MNLDLFKSKVIMTSSEYLAFAVGFVLGAVLVGFWVNYSHANYKEVVKTNIGEFIISEGKIFSGGKQFNENKTQASLLNKAYLSLINDTIINILSELPHNTKSEADEAFKLIGKSKLILVTTASHMPRSVYLFNKMGCNVIAAPCDFSVKDLEYFPNFPNGMSINQTEIAIHEYVAILGYKLFD